MKNTIEITTDKGTSEEKTKTIETPGYLILAIKDDKIRMTGSMDLSAMAKMITPEQLLSILGKVIK